MSAFNVEVLAKSASDGPVAMLNLVKYRNREAYAEYGKLTGRLVAEHGGRMLWAGSVAEVVLDEGGDADWDFAAIVVYPSRQAFVDLVTSAEYLDANEVRRRGIVKHIVLAADTMQFEDIIQPTR
jgi:uncharacterized protein (DUF1330 family)